MYSYWLESIKSERKNYDKLKDNIDVDVCIVGAGLTGLSTAYYLSKNSNLKIAILEKDLIGEKTSCHSTAKITSQHDLFYKYLIESQGKEFAKKYLESNEESIKEIENIIKKENIDCDFEKMDAYVYTEEDDEIMKIKDEVFSVNSIKEGLCEFVTNIKLPRNVIGAIKFKNQAQFNPAKYCIGLCKAMEKERVNIYENTKVYDIQKENDNYIITTEDNEVKAKYVVLATRYPIINIPGFYFLKMYQSTSYVICVDTKTDLFEGMYITSENPKKSFRTIKNGDKRLLLVAGFDHKTGEEVKEEKQYESLENEIRKMYPNCEIIGRWIAEDCIGLDKIPYIGKYSTLMSDLYIGTGYKKWGVSLSNVAARIISDDILGKDNPYKEIYTATRLEPIKNSKEFGNIVKQSLKSLVIDKLKIPNKTLIDIKNDEGKLIEVEGKKVGVYKDIDGNIFAVKPVCTHLGCELTWNSLERSWDCPCHGSRFNYKGESIESPSVQHLKNIDIEEEK